MIFAYNMEDHLLSSLCVSPNSYVVRPPQNIASRVIDSTLLCCKKDYILSSRGVGSMFVTRWYTPQLISLPATLLHLPEMKRERLLDWGTF